MYIWPLSWNNFPKKRCWNVGVAEQFFLGGNEDGDGRADFSLFPKNPICLGQARAFARKNEIRGCCETITLYGCPPLKQICFCTSATGGLPNDSALTALFYAKNRPHNMDSKTWPAELETLLSAVTACVWKMSRGSNMFKPKNVLIMNEEVSWLVWQQKGGNFSRPENKWKMQQLLDVHSILW